MLDSWLWEWTRWRRTQVERQVARDALNKKAARARARGDEAAAAAAEARLHRDTALAARLRRTADALPPGPLADQVRARADEALRRPPPDAAEPELSQRLAMLWLEHKGELPSPGSGELPPNAFMIFVIDCAIALGIHAPSDGRTTTPPRWRDRHRRWRRAVMGRLDALRGRPDG